jgi:hypothetical protein
MCECRERVWVAAAGCGCVGLSESVQGLLRAARHARGEGGMLSELYAIYTYAERWGVQT